MSFTEREHISMVKIGDEFGRELAKLAARLIDKSKVVDVEAAKVYLQDRADLYTPYVSDRLHDELNRLSRKRHGSPRAVKGNY